MMPGPMFTITVTKSHSSPWIGAQLSLGHAVIEIPVILLIYLGLSSFFQNIWVQIALSVIGGSMIIWMGINLLRANYKSTYNSKDSQYSSFISGILLSGLNPFFLLWWGTVGSLLLMNFLELNPQGLILFIIVHWICDFVWLSLISVTVFKTHSFISKGLMEWILTVLSLMLFYFGGQFIFQGIKMVI
jgi:threonine/homoserine/homoserine lactone efflux protein